jgi:hypothetical protein
MRQSPVDPPQKRFSFARPMGYESVDSEKVENVGKVLNPAARRRAGIAAGAAVGVALLAGCAASGPSNSEFGSFTLQPGETRRVETGHIYRNMRVCNEAGSAGAITATIDDHQLRELQAGVCAEDLGNSVLVHNQSNGVARGTYRTIYDIQFQGH